MCSNKVHKVDKGSDYYYSGDDALFMALENNGGMR